MYFVLRKINTIYIKKRNLKNKKNSNVSKILKILKNKVLKVSFNNCFDKSYQ